MAYFIKVTDFVDDMCDDMYYKGDNSWTDTFEDRKVYTNKSDADLDTLTTVTKNGVTYTPRHFKKCIVVSDE